MAGEIYNIDMSDTQERALFLREFSNLRGMVTIEVKPNRRMLSNKQRRLYFTVYVRAFQKYLYEQGQVFTVYFCHELLKRRFLREDIWDKRTGEVIGDKVRSIGDGGDVNSKEMNEYMMQVHQYLVELGIRLPEMNGGMERS